jgi:hypothetical protein
VLWQAWEEVKANHGGPGIDAQSIDAIVAAGEEAFVTTVGKQLREKTYRPQPVRRVYIPKPKGGQRPLGIPSIADRVVQTAVRLVLEPIFEADFQDCSYGYRPRRSARACSTVIRDTLYQGVHSVVEVDLMSYFDSVPHEKLIVLVRGTERARPRLQGHPRAGREAVRRAQARQPFAGVVGTSPWAITRPASSAITDALRRLCTSKPTSYCPIGLPSSALGLRPG